MEKVNRYVVSQNIKSDIKNADLKIKREYYKSYEDKQLVEKEVSSMLNRSKGMSGVVYLKLMLKGMYIFYSTIVFIVGLLLTGYIKDIKNFMGKTSED